MFECPDYLESRKKRYKNIDSLVFVNANNDTLVFEKIENRNNEIVSSFHKTVPCHLDGTIMVDLIFEREESVFTFASNNGDTLRFSYYPIIHKVIDDYSDVDIRDPQNYHYVDIILPESNTKIRQGRAEWEGPRTC